MKNVSRRAKISLLTGLLIVLSVLIAYIGYEYLNYDYYAFALSSLMWIMIIAVAIVTSFIAIFLIKLINRNYRGLLRRLMVKFIVIVTVMITIIAGILLSRNEEKIYMSLASTKINVPGKLLHQRYEDRGSFKYSKFNYAHIKSLTQVYDGSGNLQNDKAELSKQLEKHKWQIGMQRIDSDGKVSVMRGSLLPGDKPVYAEVFIIERSEHISIRQNELNVINPMVNLDYEKIRNDAIGKNDYIIGVFYYTVRYSYKQ